MKRKITEKEITFLAQILDVCEETLLSLLYLGLLNTSKLTGLLVKEEYEEYLKKGELLKKEITVKLMEKYKLSKPSIEAIVYNKPYSSYGMCEKCKTKTTKYTLLKNKGFCDECKNRIR